jgi:hypothetical protein
MPKISPDPVQTELPVTPAVEQPILNSPYYEPEEHWGYGKASRMPGRRPATYFWTTQRTGSEQLQMEGITSDYGAEDMPIVNALREDVKKWRNSNYENATQITRQLLRHWHSKDRTRRLFFCQLEAAETMIYLNEILASGSYYDEAHHAYRPKPLGKSKSKDEADAGTATDKDIQEATVWVEGLEWKGTLSA